MAALIVLRFRGGTLMLSNQEIARRLQLFAFICSTFGVTVTTEVLKAWVQATSFIPQTGFERAATTLMLETKHPASIPGALREMWNDIKRRDSREAGGCDAKTATACSDEIRAAHEASKGTRWSDIINLPGCWDFVSPLSGQPLGPAGSPSEYLIRQLVVQFGPDWGDVAPYPDVWKQEMERQYGPDWRRLWPRPEGFPPFAEHPRKSAKQLQGEMR